MKKKTVLTMLMAALLAVCGFGLTACGGPKPEEVIHQNLESTFDTLKSGEANSDVAKGLEESVGSQFESYGIDSKEFTKAFLEGFDYKIGDIKVDEKDGSATAQVSVTMKPFMEMAQGLTVKLLAEATSLPADATEDDFNAMAGKVIMSELAALEPKTVDAEVVYNKNSKGEWEPDQESFNKAIFTAMMGDADPSTISALSQLADQGSAQ